MEIHPIQTEYTETTQEQFENTSSYHTIGNREGGILSYNTPKSISFASRLLINFCLLTLKSYLIQYKAFAWIKRKIFGLSKEEKLMYQLEKYCRENKDEELYRFVYTLSLERKKDREDFEELLLELFHIKELHIHLKEIFRGANIKIEDNGSFFNKWKSNPQSYSRMSSHDHEKGQGFAFSHSLFWLDKDGHTRFQLENTPLTGISNRILHLIDYLHYIKSSEQQGILGSSIYTETNPIIIKVDPIKYRRE